MKKLTLTFFLAFISLVSFAQTSTVQTIRITNDVTEIKANLPVGTIIIDISKNDMYIAITSIEKTMTIKTAITANKLKLINVAVKSSYAVTKEVELSEDKSGLDVANQSFIKFDKKPFIPTGSGKSTIKVYLNGGLLKASQFDYVTDFTPKTNIKEPGIRFLGKSYKYDLISVTYTSNE